MWDVLFWLLWPLDFFFWSWRAASATDLDDDWRHWLFGLAVLAVLVLLFGGFCYLVARIL
jgi:hypothetical protein